MKLKKIILYFLPLFLLSLSAKKKEIPEAKQVFSLMMDACDHLHTARYNLSKIERIKTGAEFRSEILVKLQAKPFKAYAYSINPNPGAEALYVPTDNNGKVLVKPNKFPYVNLSVSPDNFILREHEHHSMRELGFEYISKILKDMIQKNPDFFYDHLVNDGDVEVNKKKYVQLSFTNPEFGITSYKIKKGENLMDIARHMDISEYMILCLNSSLKEYDDAREGQVIKVPSCYAKKIVFLIDKTTYLPLVQTVYDDKGLYEKYECSSMVVNPEFASDEFTPHFKGYGF